MADKSIKIIQWNIRSLNANRYSLQQLLFEERFDIGLLSETWSKPSDTVCFNNFNVVNKSRIRGYGGVAIILANNIIYNPISFVNNFNPNLEVCGVDIKIDQKMYTILSVYRPSNVRVTVQDYVSLFSQISNDCIITGDFNAHHGLWGSNSCCVDGNILVEALDFFPNLIVVNDGSATRATPPGNMKSVVDLTIISSSLCPSFDWTVLPDTYGSDHFPIRLSVQNMKIENRTFISSAKWSMSNANWDNFRNNVESAFRHEPNKNQTNEMIFFLLDSITDAANKSFKIIKPSVKSFKSPPWWDDECLTASNARKNSFKIYKSNLTLSNFMEYKKNEAICKRTFRSKAKSSWARFCSSLTRQTSPSELWKRVNKIQGNKKYTANDECMVERLFTKISPDYVHLPLFMPSISTNDHFLLTPISADELKANIKSSKNTAPGIDGINYSMLLNLPAIAIYYLCKIYNNILLKGDHCDALKQCLVIPIPKLNQRTDLRPISLMSCLLKTFERVMKSRLEWWCENKNIFPVSQYGFRRNKGTIDCVSQLTTDIQLSYSNNNYLSAIFLDISGAYDNVNLNLLFEKLKHIGIPPLCAYVLVNLFLNRQVFIRCNDRLIGPRVVHQGLPQGSVLSPLLFNLYTLDLHSIGIRCSILQYADDFCFYNVNKLYQQSINSTKMVLGDAREYFFKQGFDLTANKSAVVFFTRHRLPVMTSIMINNLSIPVHKHYTYLGITLDTKLTWDEHINKCLIKCEKSLNILKVVNRYRWGADPKINLMFYRAYTRSILDYGSILYGSATNSRLKKLDRIQYKALRLVLGALKSTPIENLLAESMEPPLHLRRLFLAEKFILKCQSYNQTELLQKICDISVSNLVDKWWHNRNSPILAVAYSNVSQHLNSPGELTFFKSSFNISYANVNVWFPNFDSENPVDFQQHIAKLDNPCRIFTDGSKSRLGVGCAVYIPDHQESLMFKLDKQCSIYSAEMFAIYQALEWAVNKKISNKQVVIMSDSRSSLLALENTRKHLYKNSLVVKILENQLKLLEKQTSVTFVWVKGHIGISGNIKADFFAKEAILKGSEITWLDRSDLTATRKKSLKQNWDIEWHAFCNRSNNLYTKIHPSLPTEPFAIRSYPNRNIYAMFIRCLFNHATVKSYLYRFNLSESDLCDCNGYVDDINHWLFGCKHNDVAIKFLMNNLVQEEIPFPQNNASLLYLSRRNSKIKQIIWEFLKRTKRKI